jgi:hypothetical protein
MTALLDEFHYSAAKQQIGGLYKSNNESLHLVAENIMRFLRLAWHLFCEFFWQSKAAR